MRGSSTIALAYTCSLARGATGAGQAARRRASVALSSLRLRDPVALASGGASGLVLVGRCGEPSPQAAAWQMGSVALAKLDESGTVRFQRCLGMVSSATCTASAGVTSIVLGEIVGSTRGSWCASDQIGTSEGRWSDA